MGAAMLRLLVPILWFGFFCVGAYAGPLAPLPDRLKHCGASAFAGADNDIRIHADDRQRGKSVPLPKAVREAMDANTDWVTASYRRHGAEGAIWFDENETCRDVYPLVNRIALPGGLELYVVHAAGEFGAYYYLLYVYDPASGRLTKKPANIFGKWADKSDDFLRRPYVSTADLRGDGRYQIVFEEVVHNGDVYNGVVYNYFDIGPDLELTHVLAVEARCQDPVDPDNRFERTITPIGSGDLRLELSYFTPRGTLHNGDYAVLRSPGPGKPYHIVRRHVAARPGFSRLSRSNADVLITIDPNSEGDDAFVKDGSVFRY